MRLAAGGLRGTPLHRWEAASFQCASGIDGVTAFDDLADHALLVDHEGDAVRPAENGDEDVVGFGNALVFVAEDGELDAEGFCKSFVLGAAINADAEDLRAGRFELGDISLIRLQLARSAAGEGFDVEGQHEGFLPAKVGEPDCRAGLVGQRKVGRRIAHFE